MLDQLLDLRLQADLLNDVLLHLPDIRYRDQLWFYRKPQEDRRL
jgi:hypothetical protein